MYRWQYVEPLEDRHMPSALSGDFNKNGCVDAAKDTLWRDNLGRENTLANDAGLGSPSGQAYSEHGKDTFSLFPPTIHPFS